MVCHHGAGYSGLSFACFAKEVTEMTKGECGVLALDARRHGTKLIDDWDDRPLIFSEGKTSSSDTGDSDLSIGVLVADFCAVLQAIYTDPASAPSLLVHFSSTKKYLMI